ncbi:MAG: hypothetical protein QW727_01310 [Candidatus Pacearchaeota archaeon]
MKKEPLIFIIFGGTGDLAKRRLVPAFSQLVNEGIINKNSTLIGISRQNISDNEYRDFLINSVNEKRGSHNFNMINIKYLSIDFSNVMGIKKLSDTLPFCEADNCNRIFYFATSFKLFSKILKGLVKFNLISKHDKFNKIVFEKPFGEDLKSSDEIEREIHEIIDEKNIFRVDHYLGKESVQNIIEMKFASDDFHNLISKSRIKEINIIVDEKIGVENRIKYYDDFGAIKDMIQNHMLQVLSLLLMEKPKKFDAEYIHNEKIKVLKKIDFLNPKESLIGQYKSYLNEIKKIGLKKSNTETFAKILLNYKTQDYKHTKIFLRTGKKLPRSYGKVIVDFISSKNKIIINLQPNEDIEIIYNGKIMKNIDLCPGCKFAPNTPDAYGVLLKEIINNDKRLFVRSDEIHESWRIVDEIIRNKINIPFVVYPDYFDPEKL